MELTEKTVEQNVLFEGVIIRVRKDQAELPNGHIAGREVVEHPGGVAVLAMEEDGTVYTVKQFRYPFAQVVEKVESYIDRMKTMFVLENLDNLRKNGRLTRMQSIVTGALRVKLLCGATPEGEIQKLGQGLTVRQTLAKMVGRMAEDPDHVERRLVIAHCNCLERAETVREMVRQKCR